MRIILRLQKVGFLKMINNNFYQTPEWRQSMKMRPACNRVLKYVFGVKDDDIIRFENKEGGVHVLDQEFAIDLKVKIKNNMQLSGQEKALTYENYKWKTFTIEFYQNRFTKEPGEWFKIASQFYLSGYSDKSGIRFIEWKIIKMFDFMLWQRQFSINYLESITKPSTRSNANFLPIKYCDIPEKCIYAKYKNGIIDINGKIDDLFKLKNLSCG
jgi:hypothetical protein